MKPNRENVSEARLKAPVRNFSPTDRAILLAVKELMKKNAWGKITVEAVAKRAGVSKATFYRHFKDKYDLLYCLVIQQVELVNSEGFEGADKVACAALILKQLQAGGTLWKRLRRDDSRLAMEMLEVLFAKLLCRQFLRVQQRVPDAREEVWIDCLSACGAKRVFHWLAADCSEPANAVIADILELYQSPRTLEMFAL